MPVEAVSMWRPRAYLLARVTARYGGFSATSLQLCMCHIYIDADVCVLWDALNSVAMCVPSSLRRGRRICPLAPGRPRAVRSFSFNPFDTSLSACQVSGTPVVNAANGHMILTTYMQFHMYEP